MERVSFRGKYNMGVKRTRASVSGRTSVSCCNHLVFGIEKNRINTVHCRDFYRALATATVGVREAVGRERALEMW